MPLSARKQTTLSENNTPKRVCTSWIWYIKNTPKLGGFGKIVEMDECFFHGIPKYNRGRRLGTRWDDDEKWVFGLFE